MNNMKTRAVFVHSHIFLYDPNNNAYSEGKLIYETWGRYLKHFDELFVLGRFKDINRADSYNISSGPNVFHVKMPNISTIKDRRKHVIQTKVILKENIQNADVVIARLPSVHGSLAIKIAKQLKKPYVIELVGDVFSSLWFHGSIIGKVLAPFSFVKVKRNIKKAPYVMYVTEKFLQNKYPSKQLIVGTSCSNVEIHQSMRVERKKNIERNNFTIGLIGSYNSKYKGIINAINVLKKLNDENMNVELRILGSGNANWILEHSKNLGVESFVKLDGSLPAGQKVFEWLSELDLYIQPSLTEGLPRALIEAMYCQLPCVASNVGGIPELLPDSNLHAPKDESKMYEIIKKMYNDENYRKEQSELNLMKARKYTKEMLDEKRLLFWKEVLEDLGGENT